MSIRRLLKAPLRAALGARWARDKIAFELRRDYYRDLQVIVPLSHGMVLPIARADYVHSVSEVFFSGEYGSFLDQIPLPRRWIDLGCHAGYFSLFLAWQWRRAGGGPFEALLIDADPRVGPDIAYLSGLNGLERQFRFRAGLIGSGAGRASFAVREGMGSSGDLSTRAEGISEVAIVTAEEIRAALAPPYDLLKLDVEGAEYDFVEHYGAVLRDTRHAVAEWHSWDAEGSGDGRLRDAMGKSGFELQAVLQPRKNHVVEGRALSAGCHLYRNLK